MHRMSSGPSSRSHRKKGWWNIKAAEIHCRHNGKRADSYTLRLDVVTISWQVSRAHYLQLLSTGAAPILGRMANQVGKARPVCMEVTKCSSFSPCHHCHNSSSFFLSYTTADLPLVANEWTGPVLCGVSCLNCFWNYNVGRHIMP